MRECTLVFPKRGGEVLLGMKKRGFGADKWNGFGGKVEARSRIGEKLIRETAIRELEEECGLTADIKSLVKSAVLDFSFPEKPDWNQRVHVYLLYDWRGFPIESEEMLPDWFLEDSIPYDKLWVDDRYWLPLVLQGEFVEASFTFAKLGKEIASFEFKSPKGIKSLVH